MPWEDGCPLLGEVGEVTSGLSPGVAVGRTAKQGPCRQTEPGWESRKRREGTPESVQEQLERG